MNTEIVIINESKTATDIEIQAMIPAFQTQVNRDLIPIWRGHTKEALNPVTISFGTLSTAPATAWQVAILDNTDQAGALGYHDLTDAGLPLAKIFAESDKEYGLSLSITISHEINEMVIDPDINYITKANNNITIVEICDPVEDDSLGYNIGDIRVSDFVTPAYFGLAAPSGVNSFSFNNTIHGGFPTLAPGGYTSIYVNGQWNQLTARRVNGAFSPRAIRSDRMQSLQYKHPDFASMIK